MELMEKGSKGDWICGNVNLPRSLARGGLEDGGEHGVSVFSVQGHTDRRKGQFPFGK